MNRPKKSGFSVGFFCHAYFAVIDRRYGSAGCRSPQYQWFLKPTKNNWTEVHNLEKTQSGLYNRKRRVHGTDLWGIPSPWANLPVICGQVVPYPYTVGWWRYTKRITQNFTEQSAVSCRKQWGSLAEIPGGGWTPTRANAWPKGAFLLAEGWRGSNIGWNKNDCYKVNTRR